MTDLSPDKMCRVSGIYVIIIQRLEWYERKTIPQILRPNTYFYSLAQNFFRINLLICKLGEMLLIPNCGGHSDHRNSIFIIFHFTSVWRIIKMFINNTPQQIFRMKREIQYVSIWLTAAQLSLQIHTVNIRVTYFHNN